MDNTKTTEEIQAFVESIWEKACEKNYMETPDKIKITQHDDEIQIRVESMYSAPGLNFDILSQLSEFFKTRNINDDDRFGHRGCDTCDYGSCYGFTLTVRPD
jgi:hypothetical protein